MYKNIIEFFKYYLESWKPFFAYFYVSILKKIKEFLDLLKYSNIFYAKSRGH